MRTIHTFVCLGLCPGIVACVDLGRAPLAEVAAPEVRPTLDLDDGLPSLLALEREVGLLTGDRDDARTDLLALGPSTDEGSDGADRDERIAAVADRIGPEGVARVVDQVGEFVAAAELAAAEPDGETLRAPVRIASAFVVRARQTLMREGRSQESLTLALSAAEALERVSPDQVARRLRAAASTELGRNPDSAPYDSVDRERAVRLLRGVEEALEGDDPVRALRRAYYACQLLGLDMRTAAPPL